MRQKEYSLRELYTKRQTSIAKIPKFWPTVLANGPEELQEVFVVDDVPFLEALKSMKVERPGIKTEAEGEPRSLKFTFHFDKNDLFEDKVITKTFEFRAGEDGGALVSTPVTFKWTDQAKKKGVNQLLDLAHDLWKAERAFTSGAVDAKERENLWQCQKLKEALEKVMDSGDGLGFLNWFGYRGLAAATAVQAEDDQEQTDMPDEVEDLEIFPDGDDIAMVLAEELWPNVMDYFVRAQEDSDDDDMDDLDEQEDDDEAPILVDAEKFEGLDDDEEKEEVSRPAKRTKRS